MLLNPKMRRQFHRLMNERLRHTDTFFSKEKKMYLLLIPLAIAIPSFPISPYLLLIFTRIKYFKSFAFFNIKAIKILN